MHYLFLILAIAFNTSANLILKLSAAQETHSIFDKLTNIYFYLSMACFAINFLFYAKALERLNLSVAYPIVVGCTIVLSIVLSMAILHEKLAIAQVAGLFLIISGIVLIFAKQS